LLVVILLKKNVIKKLILNKVTPFERPPFGVVFFLLQIVFINKNAAYAILTHTSEESERQ